MCNPYKRSLLKPLVLSAVAAASVIEPCGQRVGQKPGHWRVYWQAGLPRHVLPAAGTCGCIHCRLPSTHLPCYRSRKRRGSETLSEEEERSSGDEHARMAQRRGRRCQGVVRRKEGRRRGEEVERHTFPKLLGRTGSPIMTECTAAMVLMDLSGSPASRVSHASGQSGKRSPQC